MQTPAENVLDRMVRAVETVRARLRRATVAMNIANVPYAVVGDFAVATWVESVDASAVRNTPEVELLVRRADLPSTRNALIAHDFVYREVGGRVLFLDTPDSSERSSVRIYFAGETLRPEATVPFPDPAEDRVGIYLNPDFKILNLGPLVMTSLSSFRNLDALRVRDLIDVGLVDRNWLEYLAHGPPELIDRLRTLLDNPNG